MYINYALKCLIAVFTSPAFFITLHLPHSSLKPKQAKFPADFIKVKHLTDPLWRRRRVAVVV